MQNGGSGEAYETACFYLIRVTMFQDYYLFRESLDPALSSNSQRFSDEHKINPQAGKVAEKNMRVNEYKKSPFGGDFLVFPFFFAYFIRWPKKPSL